MTVFCARAFTASIWVLLASCAALQWRAHNPPRQCVVLGCATTPRSIPSGAREMLAKATRIVTTTILAFEILPRNVWGIDGPAITAKVYLDIKIANYSEESIGTNRGASGSGRVVIGLYGIDSPKNVALFLSALNGNGVDQPNFVNSQFERIDESSGLVLLGGLRRLNKLDLGGSVAFEFGGVVMPQYSTPNLESNSLRHSRRGFLTRSKLTSTPEFGITTRAAPSLDGFHCVFGEILEGLDTLDAISSIPVITDRAPDNSGLAESWFEAQKAFYVGVGEAIGDERASKARQRAGKLLRRVTVTSGGVVSRGS